jgi:hypothetical protein
MVSRIFWIEGQRLALMARPLGGDRLDDEIAVLNAQGISAARGLTVPDTDEQRAWIAALDA